LGFAGSKRLMIELDLSNDQQLLSRTVSRGKIMTEQKSEQEVQDPNITSEDKTWAMLSYLLGIIFPIIILLMEDKKNRPFLKAHYFQALAYWIVAGVVSAIFSLITYSMSFAGGAFIIVLAAIPAIIWGLKANDGEYVEIPVITEFIKNQGWTN
jgi:uncharacterized membrane protein